MDIANVILQYLKVLFSGPIITLILVISFFVLFKDSISDFISRLIKGEAYGVKFQAGNPSEQKKEAEELPQIKPQDELERYVKDNPKEVIKNLIEISRKFRFERIFNVIYGTQINLLIYLSTKGEPGDKYINLVSYYNDFMIRSRLYSAKIEDYFGFLHTMKLIEFFDEGSNFSVKITPEGINFLSYIKSEYSASFNYKPF